MDEGRQTLPSPRGDDNVSKRNVVKACSAGQELSEVAKAIAGDAVSLLACVHGGNTDSSHRFHQDNEIERLHRVHPYEPRRTCGRNRSWIDLVDPPEFWRLYACTHYATTLGGDRRHSARPVHHRPDVRRRHDTRELSPGGRLRRSGRIRGACPRHRGPLGYTRLNAIDATRARLQIRFASVSQKLWQLFAKGRAYVAEDRRRAPEALRRAGRPQLLRAQRSLTLDNPGHRSLASGREHHERSGTLSPAAS